jgi:hypothetical protein
MKSLPKSSKEGSPYTRGHRYEVDRKTFKKMILKFPWGRVKIEQNVKIKNNVNGLLNISKHITNYRISFGVCPLCFIGCNLNTTLRLLREWKLNWTMMLG